MDIQRANELAKTVPVPKFLLGDVVKTKKGVVGIIVGVTAWDDDEPTYVGYKIQVSDPGPLNDDDGNVYDVFSTQDEYAEYCFKPEELALVSRHQAGMWVPLEQEAPPVETSVLATVISGDFGYALCDWDGYFFSDVESMRTMEPQPTHWAKIPPLDIDPFGYGLDLV